MRQTRWPLRLITGTLVLLPLIGAALAAGGTQSDPLVTLSYLNNKATPEILSQLEVKLSQQEQLLTAQLNDVVAQYKQDIERLLNTGTSASGGISSVYTVVTLNQGQQLIGKDGCEFLLRSGSATCISDSAPGLVDMTGGTTLANGGSLVRNHLYLGTIEGRGLKATSSVTVMVRGRYVIS